MPLFSIKSDKVVRLDLSSVPSEKHLQNLIEKNLDTIFGAKFVATEFSTGARHSGRIDTLALDEDLNPVIIEYKATESSDLITQSLFYLSWLDDHRADFELAARKKLGDKIEIDWDKIRVICIAPGFKKYDLHAVGVMGANIELWQFQLHGKEFLHLEKIYPSSRADAEIKSGKNGKNPVMVSAGKKAAETRRNAVYTFEEHIEGKEEEVISLVSNARDFILNLSDAVEENPKKFYVAYKVSQNFACMEVRKNKVTFFLKLNPKEIRPLPKNCRDVSNIGHYGTGDFEVSVKSHTDLEGAKPLIKQAFEKIGG